MKESIERHRLTHPNIARALEAGLAKLSVHLDKAFKSKYPLIGAGMSLFYMHLGILTTVTVLHPSVRLTFFEDKERWEPSTPERARNELKMMYDEYSKARAPSQTASVHAEQSSKSTCAASKPAFGFAGAVALRPTKTTNDDAVLSELELYFSGAYPCSNVYDVLQWWKVFYSPIVTASISLNTSNPEPCNTFPCALAYRP